MNLQLKKDDQGNFIPASEEELAVALAGGIPMKHNSSNSQDSVLFTALQEAEESADMTLEEMGL